MMSCRRFPAPVCWSLSTTREASRAGSVGQGHGGRSVLLRKPRGGCAPAPHHTPGERSSSPCPLSVVRHTSWAVHKARAPLTAPPPSPQLTRRVPDSSKGLFWPAGTAVWAGEVSFPGRLYTELHFGAALPSSVLATAPCRSPR